MKTLALGFVFALAGCCSCPHAVTTAKGMISTLKGDMNDDSLPIEAREIATDDHDAFWAIVNHLDDTPLPEDVAARKAVRDEAKKAAAGGGQ